MKNTGKRINCFLLVAVMACMILGCGKKEAKQVETDLSGIGNVTQWSGMESIPVPKNQNLLTGIADLSKEAIGKRPVAVMVNNVEDALPQYGVAQADLIFELPVEGDLTRLMAVYGDYTQVPDICAIRSCRYYYPAIAKGFDAFYVHWGIDQSVADYVAGIQPDKFDGISNTGGLFGRDTARRKAGYALEHTGYFKGTQFAKVADESGKRTELRDAKKNVAFQFCDYGESVTPIGENCNTVTIRFGASTSKFNYDAEKKTYAKFMNGHTHVDGKTGEQLSFTNVLVLETSISVRDTVGHKKIDWQGSGTAKGYYISNGVVQKIHWSQKDENSYLKFYDENGEELTINRGKSYIAYTYGGKTNLES